MEPKQKQHPVVDGASHRSKAWCCKEQYCIGIWNVRSINQGKLEVVKQEMVRVNIELDYKESWALKNWCFWAVVLEDSWESFELQGDPTSPSWRRSAMGVHWKDWCWSWNFNTLAPDGVRWAEVTQLRLGVGLPTWQNYQATWIQPISFRLTLTTVCQLGPISFHLTLTAVCRLGN